MPLFNDTKSKFRKKRKDTNVEGFNLDKINTEGEASNPEVKKSFSFDGISPFKKPNKKEEESEPDNEMEDINTTKIEEYK